MTNQEWETIEKEFDKHFIWFSKENERDEFYEQDVKGVKAFLHSQITAAEQRIAREVIEEEKQAKDTAYHERNQLVAFLTRSYPAHIKLHPAIDLTWEDDWRHIVCVHTPVGQMTWHIHDNELPMFNSLNRKPELFPDCEWDGHTTDEKYKRLANLPQPQTTTIS